MPLIFAAFILGCFALGHHLGVPPSWTLVWLIVFFSMIAYGASFQVVP